MADGVERVLALVLSFVFPPLGVLMLRGCGRDLLINILLTIVLLWLGGMIHAVWIAVADASAEDRRRAALPVTAPAASPYAGQQPPYPLPAGAGAYAPPPMGAGAGGVAPGYPAHPQPYPYGQPAAGKR
ncbi:hypothetical protein Rsub_02647 [Raphidocelis subcapitata]|uniref:Uncharacterized protein n=1 Tax=Raphidocelis subcapitata TaxID=307507 RepID=A0A2V0NWK2_9CHLO|nr:hypothetical protein Rsub_02647 [Raphidocelis subcapitata]|eukprot:GBF89943.1 hypothetical protein Rsub_02647 [Raphidocelis subcapitata]